MHRRLSPPPQLANVTANHSLEGCVSSLRESLGLVQSSIQTLGSAVNDFPRLTKVLQLSRHFELVSEPELQAAQAALQSEIEPEVNSLLTRVEAYLDKLQRREEALKAKCELQQGRLGDAPLYSKSRFEIGLGRDQSSKHDNSQGAVSALKMSQARQKKERLSYAIDRLLLQAQQKERQLRKSLAVPVINDDD